MSKKTGKPEGKKVAKKVIKGRQVAQAAKTAGVLKVKAEQKFEGARQAWYAALSAYDGKDAEAFVQACSKKPPAVPKSGKAEGPRGWLRYFVRNGVASLT